jgi:hypothetical protein
MKYVIYYTIAHEVNFLRWSFFNLQNSCSESKWQAFEVVKREKFKCGLLSTSIKNMLEWSEGLADWAQHHIQEIQGFSPHISDRPSDPSTQFGHYPI